MNGINNIGASNGGKYQSQRDPKWGNTLMGGSNLMVKDYGCAITCLSMLSDYYGCYQDPGQIALNPKFDPGGSVNWIGLDFPTFSFRYSDGNLFSANFQPNNEMLLSYIDNGAHNNPDRAAIIQMLFTPPKNQPQWTHYLVALWPTDGDIYVIDPWDGKSKNLLASYGTYGKINQVVYFTRWDKTKHNGQQAWQGQGKPQAPLYN